MNLVVGFGTALPRDILDVLDGWMMTLPPSAVIPPLSSSALHDHDTPPFVISWVSRASPRGAIPIPIPPSPPPAYCSDAIQAPAQDSSLCSRRVPREKPTRRAGWPRYSTATCETLQSATVLLSSCEQQQHDDGERRRAGGHGGEGLSDSSAPTAVARGTRTGTGTGTDWHEDQRTQGRAKAPPPSSAHKAARRRTCRLGTCVLFVGLSRVPMATAEAEMSLNLPVGVELGWRERPAWGRSLDS